MTYEVHPHEAAFIANLSRWAHPVSQCEGQTCVVHNPLDGPWRALWSLWRQDRGIVERICQHGTGHPDPSQFEHWRAIGQDWQSIHGCDGCCSDWLITDVEDDEADRYAKGPGAPLTLDEALRVRELARHANLKA